MGSSGQVPCILHQSTAHGFRALLVQPLHGLFLPCNCAPGSGGMQHVKIAIGPRNGGNSKAEIQKVSAIFQSHKKVG